MFALFKKQAKPGDQKLCRLPVKIPTGTIYVCATFEIKEEAWTALALLDPDEKKYEVRPITLVEANNGRP